MHIVFANRYFAPDVSATSQIVSDLAQHLASLGYRVEVITSRQLYDDAGAKLPARQTVKGVHVRRIRTSTFGRDTLPGRALDYLTFYLSFFVSCLSVLQKDSVLVCCTDPPLLSIPASLACLIKRARLINWLQDVYPEVAVALGVMGKRSPLTRCLTWLRDHSLRAAHRNVVLGEVMGQKIQAHGLDPDRISIVHNWSIAPFAPPGPGGWDNPLRRDWGIADRFVVGYSGNLGKAHEIETLLQAAQALRSEAGICFLIIGAGHYTPELQRRARALRLENIHFQPYQPLEQLHYSLAAADVHLVILRPEMEGCIVPSKFYGAAASGRPIIFIGSEQGEVAHILRREQAGIVVTTGDDRALATAILALRDQPGLHAELGTNARRISEETYTREHSLAQWAKLIQG